MLTTDTIQAIDRARQKGASHDEIRAAITGQGIPDDEADALLDHYRQTPLPDGRSRDEVNLGEP